jgi:hypothetical protein
VVLEGKEKDWEWLGWWLLVMGSGMLMKTQTKQALRRSFWVF